MISVGVVGAGRMSQRAHIPNLLAERELCEVVALADPKVETARLVAERFHLPRTYSSMDDLLGAEDVDALAISVPDQLHAAFAIAALEAGKHVFMEKPLATHSEDGRRMLRAAQASGKVFQVAYQRRHDPAAEIVKQFVADWRQSGEMGELRYVRYLSLGGDWQCVPEEILNAGDEPVTELPPYVPPEWLDEQLERPWHSMNNYTSHVLDLLRFIMGTPTSVLSAHLDRPAAWSVEMDWGGVPVGLVQGPGHPGRWEEWIEFLFDGGWLRFSTPPALRVNTPGRIEVYRAREGRREEIEAPFEWAFRREIHHFLRAVEGEVPPSPTPEDALATLVSVEAIFKRAMEMSEPRSIDAI